MGEDTRPSISYAGCMRAGEPDCLYPFNQGADPVVEDTRKQVLDQ